MTLYLESISLSIVIPALNEAEHIATLLNALGQQTFLPDEIIVADAGSTDGTVEIAEQYGAKVVPGGLPAVGRNAGAAVAKGNIILFLDADVLPAPHFIEAICGEFIAHDLAVATCLIEAISDRRLDHLLHKASNLFLIAAQKVSPHAPGCVILVRRDIHYHIGGFDETLALAEDHDYVKRASKQGGFSVLRNVRMPVSVRRFDSDGTISILAKYLWVEAHIITGQPVRSIPFDYQFGQFKGVGSSSSFMTPVRDYFQDHFGGRFFGKERQELSQSDEVFSGNKSREWWK